LTLPRGKSKSLVTTVALQPQLIAPLAMGDPVGTVQLSLDDVTVYESPVMALEAVEPSGFFARLWDSIMMWISGLFAT
jgi:D-alanyl-D-alanine carboxypeptidase (penicillin-binding protein 5/6)